MFPLRNPYPPGARTKFIAGAPQSSHLDVRPRFTFALVARGLLAGVSASLAVAVPSIASGRKIWKRVKCAHRLHLSALALVDRCCNGLGDLVRLNCKTAKYYSGTDRQWRSPGCTLCGRPIVQIRTLTLSAPSRAGCVVWKSIPMVRIHRAPPTTDVICVVTIYCEVTWLLP
jgi:hypothetical protein